MAVVCCDTSFLYSVYGHDTNTSHALDALKKLRQPITLTLLNEFEFLNALRLSIFRKVITSEMAAAIVAAFEADLELGRIVLDQTNLTLLLLEAKRLSSIYTISAGFRTFDIIHVAGALHLKADKFLTFDSNQQGLARELGLKG
jgi:predicted nucleic acid-binding protein